MAVTVNDDCVGCGSCVNVCPAGAIEINANGKAEADDSCVECGACISSCPTNSITL